MLNSWWQPVILWRRSHLGQFSVTISPIRILRRRCKKYTELCSRVMFSSCRMSSLHDYMIYCKGLVFCSKKQSQRNKCPGQAMCWIWGGIPRLVFLLHYVPLGGRAFYCSGWKWARRVFRVYLSLVSQYRRLIQLNRQNKVFRYLNAHLILHMRDPEFKVVWEPGFFYAISPSQNVFQNILLTCWRMTKVLKIDLESNKEKKKI